MQLIEAVPNFSTGDPVKASLIAECFKNRKNVALLDYSADADHNRCVITVVGEPRELREALNDSAERALGLIDLRAHRGVHPRIGALDVLPLVPLGDTGESVALELAQALGRDLHERHSIPVWFYEKSATAPHRANLAEVRRGGFEGLGKKIVDPLWHFDLGQTPHPTAGATAVGVRKLLVAFNVNLSEGATTFAAKEVARRLRFSSGGLRYVKALGLFLEREGGVQVSINLTDFASTRLHTVFELLRSELRPYGAEVRNSELIGLAPYTAIYDAAEYFLTSAGRAVGECLSMDSDEILDAANSYLGLDIVPDKILDFAVRKAFGEGATI